MDGTVVGVSGRLVPKFHGTSGTFVRVSRRIFPSIGAIPATLGQCAITGSQCHRTRDYSGYGHPWTK